MKLIVVANIKGGVGKTFVASNLAVTLANQENSVLFVDQAQTVANGTKWLLGEGCETENLTYYSTAQSGAWDQDGCKADVVILDCAPGSLDQLKGNIDVLDSLVLVTTPDAKSVLSALATTRELVARKPNVRISLVVNMVNTIAQGKKCAQKLMKNITFWLSSDVSFFTVLPFDHKQSSEMKSGNLFCQRFDKGAIVIGLGLLADHVMSDPMAIESSDWIKSLAGQKPDVQDLAA